jgi:microcystin-dependent protein
MPAAASVPNTFVAGTDIVAADANANFSALVSWLNTNAVAVDGTKAFTGIPDLPASDPTTANQAVRKAYVDAATPVGTIVMYGGAAAPSRWLLCQGQLVSRATYADLFAAIGTAFGAGDGATTFKLPDLQDRFPMGKGASFPTLGATGGSKDAITVTHSHTMGNHTHTGTTGNESVGHQHGYSGSTASDGAHTHAYDGGYVNLLAAAGTVALSAGGVSIPNPAVSAISSSGAHQHAYSGTTGGITVNHTHDFSTSAPSTNTTSSEGSSGTNANLPPYQVVNFIIRTNV